MAQKARENNEKKRVAVERIRAGYGEAAEAKRSAMEQDQEAKRLRREAHIASLAARGQKAPNEPSDELSKQKKGEEAVQKIERAAEKRREVLAEISSKAGRHFEGVKAKTEVCQQRQAEEHAERTKHLEQSLAQKAALRKVGVEERSGRAGQHNEAVAGKVQKHLEEVKHREEELLSKHQQKSGSKVDGRVGEAKVTGGPAIAAAALRAGSQQSADNSAEVASRGYMIDLVASVWPCARRR
jgi:hypothetical protein